MHKAMRKNKEGILYTLGDALPVKWCEAALAAKARYVTPKEGKPKPFGGVCVESAPKRVSGRYSAGLAVRGRLVRPGSHGASPQGNVTKVAQSP